MQKTPLPNKNRSCVPFNWNVLETLWSTEDKKNKYQQIDFFLILALKIHDRNVKICPKHDFKARQEANMRHHDVNIYKSHFKEAGA